MCVGDVMHHMLFHYVSSGPEKEFKRILPVVVASFPVCQLVNFLKVDYECVSGKPGIFHMCQTAHEDIWKHWKCLVECLKAVLCLVGCFFKLPYLF